MDVIHRYSIDKITAYWDACQENDKDHLKLWTSAMRGDPKQVNEFFKKSSRVSETSTSDGKANKQDVRKLQGLLGGK